MTGIIFDRKSNVEDVSVGSVGISERGFPKDVAVTDAWKFAGFWRGHW